ncbi:MAG: hypothetical protein U5N55_04930 [Cypionkella sp.]|nr:hypothetical protein [Cypionkella sp.]
MITTRGALLTRDATKAVELPVGANGLILGSNGTDVLYTPRIALQTSVASTSGMEVPFTGIPSWAKRVTVFLQGVSIDSISDLQFQIGTSAGYEITGYEGANTFTTGGAATTNFTAGFAFRSDSAAALFHGKITFELMNAATNLWVANGGIGASNFSYNNRIAGTKALAGALDRVRLISVSGTANFDAGLMNIAWE